MLNIPFENLDIIYGNSIVLKLERIYDKIIKRGRGGFCYELNGLFSWLLRELGYNVSLVSARVNQEDGTFGKEFDHLGIIVHFGDKKYLVDVGFGDSTRKPIEFPDGMSEDVSGKYRLIRDNRETYYLEWRIDKHWACRYKFSLKPRELNDFKGMCRFFQASEESHFNKNPFISLATKTGRITLTDKELIITDGIKKSNSKVNSKEEFEGLLEKYFGIREI